MLQEGASPAASYIHPVIYRTELFEYCNTFPIHLVGSKEIPSPVQVVLPAQHIVELPQLQRLTTG